MPPFHLHPDALALLVVLAAGYPLALRRVGPRFVTPGDPPASRGQVAAFWLGWASMAVAITWPIHDIGERSLFTAHMIQHLLITLVAPALLLAGTPGWLLRWLLRPRWVLAVVRRLSRPFIALFLANGVLLAIHWPAFVDVYLGVPLVHFLTHVALFGSAVLMWMPILSPISEIPRISHPAQMLYLFGQSILPTVPASFLTFGSKPLYGFYATTERLWGISAITDQRIAGLAMKIIGGFILWGMITVLWFRWAKAEETGVDTLGLERLERVANREEAVR